MRFADLRLRFLTLLAAVVAGVCSLVTARQFGAGVLEDSFASRLSTYYRTSAQFMALYGLLNFYLYTMAYVYAPALQQVYGQREYLEGVTSNNVISENPTWHSLCLIITARLYRTAMPREKVVENMEKCWRRTKLKKFDNFSHMFYSK